MSTKTLKNTALLMLFSIASVLLFAASGGKGKKNTKTKVVTTKTTLSLGKISLRSGYEFKGSKLLLLTPKKDYTSFQNYTAIHNGNKTTVIASKHILSKPIVTIQNNNSNVEVKLVKLRLN